MIFQLSLITFLFFSENNGTLAPVSDLIDWDTPPGIAAAGGMTTLNDRGQITDNGHILLASLYQLLDYTVDGQFVRRIQMPKGQAIRCQTYDSVRHLYMVNYWQEDVSDPGETNSYFQFFRANGTLVKQEPAVFRVNGQAMIVNQMQHLEKDLFLFNIWNKSFKNLPSPKMLMVARRVVDETGFRLLPVGEPFDHQSAAKRQFQDNFIDRWAIFLENNQVFVVSHTMLPELQFYGVDKTPSKQHSGVDLYFEKFSTIYDLELPDWAGDRKYVADLRQKAQLRGKNLKIRDLHDYWLYHFSRVSGLYKLRDGQAILGYTSPNPKHDYYRSGNEPRQETAGIPAPYTLTLKQMDLGVAGDEVTFQLADQTLVFEGGLLLGTYKNSAYILVEEAMGPSGSGNHTYSLRRVIF